MARVSAARESEEKSGKAFAEASEKRPTNTFKKLVQKCVVGTAMSNDGVVAEIRALEDRRYQAMIDGNVAVLDELCSKNLVYTHSRGDNDDKTSYIEKVASGFFDYHAITHPADRIMIYDGAALITGRMTASVSAGGELKHVDNRYLAVWAREDGAWKFVAYQPTPLVAG